MGKKHIINLAAALIALASTSSAWSGGSIPLEPEKLLDTDYYDGIELEPVINFTNVDIFHVRKAWKRKNVAKINRKWHKLAKRYDRRAEQAGAAGLASTGNFVARSGYKSTFTMDNIPGYEGASFNGYFTLNANITEDGILQDGTFSFISSDELFNFGTETVCRSRNPNNCRERAAIREVFGGNLTDMGWSETENFIEFETGSLEGWACDMGFCSNGPAERLWFNIGSGDSLGLTTDRNVWTAHADGAAVVPVPAAAWLFGSGLLALVGFSRRKRAI